MLDERKAKTGDARQSAPCPVWLGVPEVRPSFPTLCLHSTSKVQLQSLGSLLIVVSVWTTGGTRLLMKKPRGQPDRVPPAAPFPPTRHMAARQHPPMDAVSGAAQQLIALASQCTMRQDSQVRLLLTCSGHHPALPPCLHTLSKYCNYDPGLSAAAKQVAGRQQRASDGVSCRRAAQLLVVWQGGGTVTGPQGPAGISATHTKKRNIEKDDPCRLSRPQCLRTSQNPGCQCRSSA